MRILATADSQIGCRTVTLESQADVLAQTVALAIDRDVDFVLHGGDLFHGPTITPQLLRLVFDGLRPLRDAGIPFLVIRGNGSHDLAMQPVNALDILREIPGITVSDRPQGIRRDGVSIITLPWVHPGTLIAKMNGGVTHDDANEVIAALLVRIAGELRAQALADDKTVLLAHWAISGSKLPTGLAVEEMREPILPWADLDALGFDLIIGAHIHQPQQISDSRIDDTLGVVLGSPQQLNFGEHGDHGCWIFDGDDWSAEFIPLDAPRFVTIDEQYVGDEIREGDYVRVRYTATEDEAHEIDYEQIRRDIMECGAARVQIEPQIIKANRARVDTITEHLTQVEALVKWCEANEVDAAMQHRMVGRLQEWA